MTPASHKPVVLQVLPRLVTGGVERGTIEVAKALIDAGWGAIVASEGGPMVGELESTGARHITLPLASKNPFRIVQNINRLAAVIKENGITLVHARSRAPAWSAYFAAKKAGVPFVTTFHNAYGAGNAFKRRYNSIMARGVRVIAISDFVANYAQKKYGVPSAILRTIPRGVDIARFDPLLVDVERVIALRQLWQVKEGTKVIMLPGRLTRWKGQMELVAALSKLMRRDYLCLMVGSGDAGYMRELASAIINHKLGANIRLVDECRDMPAAMMVADVVVSASIRPEGFGRVIVEAAAMGRPVIATSHGGATETVIDGKTGWFVPVGNTEAMALAIDRALSMPPEKRAAMGHAAIAHVRSNFTTSLMTARTLDVYREVLGLL